MPHAIRIHAPGGPDVMKWEELAVGDPGPGEARVRHTAIGVNYIDTYHRSGLYKLPLPVGHRHRGRGRRRGGRRRRRLGEARRSRRLLRRCRRQPTRSARHASRAAGQAARRHRDRRRRDADAERPDRRSICSARRIRCKAGETILFHAAAGGVGLIACQWARALGVTMIGTVGSDEKAALAKANGCTHTIVYTRENFVERVKALTGGKGVPVVYDGVGKDTFPASLDCLSPRGLFVQLRQRVGSGAAVRHPDPLRRRARST